MTGAEALQLLIPEKAPRVTVNARDGETFTGVLVDCIPPNAVSLLSTYRIRRDAPVIVAGFVRQEYWADAEELEIRGHASPEAAADFEARR